MSTTVGKTDIILVCYNHLDLTKRYIRSLVENTDMSAVRLIVLDNSPGAETKAWITEQNVITGGMLNGADMMYFHFPENKGWIDGIHSVYHAVNSEFFITSHNDVTFSVNWLPNMLRRFRDNKVAMVGPISDFILGLQSTQFNSRGIVTEEAKFICGLFCAFRKSAIDELIAKDGYFMDPVFGKGDKEELDYAIRLADAGYKFLVARDVFIHHDGEKGFVDLLGSKEEFHVYQDTQKNKLIEKWGNDRVNAIYSLDLAERVRVAICVPLRNNYMHYKFAASLVTLLKLPGTNYINTVRYIIHESRNLLVKEALEKNATHVLFVDDDMVFPPDALVRLLEKDLDIVCGLAFRRRPPYDPCIFVNVNDKDIFPVEHINEGLMQIDACGSAFVLIKTEVFKAMPEPWYVWGDTSLGIYTDKGGLGEDIAFSLKAKRAGFNVCCDTSLIIQHIGEEEIVDEKTYIAHKNKTSSNNAEG